MILLLDFDETLFHTRAFKRAIGVEHVVCLKEPKRCLEALSQYTSVEAFLFPDVHRFLNDHAHHELSLITFGDPEFQRTKVSKSGISHLFKKMFFVGNEMKGEVARRELEGARDTIIFLDDDVKQLESMRTHCPHVVSVRIRRPETLLVEDSKQNEFPEVSNLAQFAEFLQTL